MYNALLAIIMLLAATLIMFLFLLVYFIDSYNSENILWLVSDILGIFCSMWLFSWVYKKAFGKSMFERKVIILKQKVKKKVSHKGIIYVKAQKDKDDSYILIIIATFILIINIASKELRTTGLYTTAGVLVSLHFIGNLFSARKEISGDLTSYACSQLFAGLVFYKKWYQLPKIKKIAIANASYNQPTSESNIANSNRKIVKYRLFFRFYDTNETLTLLESKNVDNLKAERHRLREKIKGI